MHSDMEFRIHGLEQEAYAAVLRAFKAQSDALTWEKEGLITELRKELRVSDDEHRELLTKVNADGLIQRIREWRKAGGSLGVAPGISQPIQDQLHSPTISASRKKQKTSHSVPFSTPSQTLHPQSIVGTTPPLSLAAKRGPASATVTRRPQHPLQYPQSNQGPLFTDEHVDRTSDSLIGRKVMTRWPDDSNFYEAIITNYNAIEGRHALVYDINTPTETVEWVNLKEIPPEDIRWIGDDPGICRRNAPSSGRGQGSSRDQFGDDIRLSQNGVVKRVSDDIEILHTDTLIQKVERMVETSYPDLLELEKAKKMLKEHEQALVDVIAKLAEACDDGSDGEKQCLQGELVGRDNWLGTNDASDMRARSTNSYDTTRNQIAQPDDENELSIPSGSILACNCLYRENTVPQTELKQLDLKGAPSSHSRPLPLSDHCRSGNWRSKDQKGCFRTHDAANQTSQDPILKNKYYADELGNYQDHFLYLINCRSGNWCSKDQKGCFRTHDAANQTSQDPILKNKYYADELGNYQENTMGREILGDPPAN